MQSPLPPAPRWKPVYTWLIAIGFLILVLTASGIESWHSYHNAIDKAAERTQTISHLIAEWLSGSFALTEHILQDVVSDLDPAEVRYPSDDLIQHTRRTNSLIRLAKTDPAILFLGLFDKQCTVTHTSIGFNLGYDLKHREYCRLAFQDPIKAFKIAPLFVALNNKMNITISYPVLTPSQEMIGFALIGLDLSFFQHWLDRIQPTEGLAISIFDTQQKLLARLPQEPDLIGKKLDGPTLRQFAASPDAKPLTFQRNSLVDRIDRLWTMRRVDHLPFIVVAGLPIEDMLAAWQAKFIFYYLLGNLTLAAVLIFGAREFNRNHRLAYAMAEMAGTDPLTGLANRRRFLEVAERRLEESRRYQQPFAVMLMDLDHFKDINDRHGHDRGDAVLRAFADIIQHTARVNDCMARWGGEEFIAILPNTHQEMALRLAERLRTLTAEMTTIPDIRFTISIGVSEYRELDTVDALIKRADEALYRAKHQGRDQVQIAL